MSKGILFSELLSFLILNVGKEFVYGDLYYFLDARGVDGSEHKSTVRNYLNQFRRAGFVVKDGNRPNKVVCAPLPDLTPTVLERLAYPSTKDKTI